MTDRVGFLSGGPVGPDGRHLLILPGDATELVDPGLTVEDLADRHGLDSVVRVPRIEFCTAIHLDGPLASTISRYAVNQLGSRCDHALPPRPGGPSVTYEVVGLAEGDRPAELRHVGPDGGGPNV
ncbi:hypothetical protein ACFQ1I_02105 [Kitasatospora arboriphila]